jgi:hypothetical protein
MNFARELLQVVDRADLDNGIAALGHHQKRLQTASISICCTGAAMYPSRKHSTPLPRWSVQEKFAIGASAVSTW